MGRLRYLELDNFKSYAGKHVVGPFDDLTCIIGPNGAGKSNMMDAISFVLGVQSKHLRSANLKELIFRRDASSAPERRASVKLIYELSPSGEEADLIRDRDRDSTPRSSKDRSGGNERDISFMRTISAAGVGSYRVNDRETTFDIYEATLKRIGVLVKARNFLVFQGDVESVASKSPLELSRLVEQISGSEEKAEEYVNLCALREEKEEAALFLAQKKKLFSAQCREVKTQRDEAEAFARKRASRDALRSEQTLSIIYTLRSAMGEHAATIATLRAEEAAATNRERAVEGRLAEARRELARVGKAAAAADKELATLDNDAEAEAPKTQAAEMKVGCFVCL